MIDFNMDTVKCRDDALEEVWEALGDIPMNPETEDLEEPFWGWPAGTPREEIWHWFDERHSKGIAYLLYKSEEIPFPRSAALIRLAQRYNHDCDVQDIEDYFEEYEDEDLVRTFGITRKELDSLVSQMADVMRRSLENSDDWIYHRDYAINTVISNYKREDKEV